jgi:hypothetical protein
MSRRSQGNCTFPAPFTDEVDQGSATVQVVVGVDGAVLSGSIVRESSPGFGRAALARAQELPSLRPAEEPGMGAADAGVVPGVDDGGLHRVDDPAT